MTRNDKFAARSDLRANDDKSNNGGHLARISEKVLAK
jgi:hypothetical protein